MSKFGYRKPKTLEDPDRPVKDTFQDALSSRWSAAAKGYFDDPYVKLLHTETVFKPPLINRGTFIRTRTIDFLVKRFLNNQYIKNSSSQIVSLGAGMDTRFFVLKDSPDCDLSTVNYFEIDFPEIADKKISAILKNKPLYSKLFDLKHTPEEHSLSSTGFHVLSGDISNFESIILPLLYERGFSLNLPTLFIAECVLVYIDPRNVNSLLNWASSNISLSLMVVYEQTLSDHAFGNMMITNLQRRGIVLKGLQKYSTAESQMKRYTDLGWDSVSLRTVWQIETQAIPDSELSRINSIERLDEIEEWQLLASHYSILIAFSYQLDSMSLEDLEACKELLDFKKI